MNETELIGSLRVEWKQAFDTAMTSHDVEVFKKIDADLTAKTTALIAPLVARADESDGKLKRFMESRGLPPGHGPVVLARVSVAHSPTPRHSRLPSPRASVATTASRPRCRSAS